MLRLHDGPTISMYLFVFERETQKWNLLTFSLTPALQSNTYFITLQETRVCVCPKPLL